MESLKDFTARMSKVEKKEEFQVGPSWSGHSRAVFDFDGKYAYLESRGYKTAKPDRLGRTTPAARFRVFFSEPTDSWWTDYMSYGKSRAELIAKEYGATLWEAPYAEEEGKWFHYWFDGEDAFEKLMRFTYDRITGVFEEKYGPEGCKYECCIPGAEPEEIVA